MAADMTGEHTPLEHELAAVAERLRRSTVQVQGRHRGGGSGVIWRSTGLIITNAHVARGPSASVKLSDGRAFEATVVARDPQRDLAAFTVEASDLPAASVGDSSALHVGALVFAVGNPWGMAGALTAGIIHALSPADGAAEPGWIQADIHLAPGNSGGPLADARGHVIGINSMVAGGLAFAVPSHAVECFLKSDGRRPRLGVTLQSVSVPLAGERVFGLLVLEVAAGSPADAAGIMLGDVLIGVDGQPLGSPGDLRRALRHVRAGNRLPTELVRGGQRIVCDVAVRASSSGTEAA
jgi:serine protease Do